MDASGTTNQELKLTIDSVFKNLINQQSKDGHWEFELEADSTITSEYILLNHYLDEINDEIEGKLANYLRRQQNHDGGWSLYPGGDFNMSASVKAYFALKLVGDTTTMPHMQRAREAVLAHGGAVNSNVFTRITLALFRQIPWRAVPVNRVEIILAPNWFPLHIYKVSYWTRTVMVPLLVLTTLKPAAINPKGISIDELFHKPPYNENYRLINPTGKWIGSLLLALDRICRPLESIIPRFLTKKSIDLSLNFIEERLNADDGLGGIFPAIANSLMLFQCLNIKKSDLRVVQARKALDKLIVRRDNEAYCQPCLSPVWDTALATHSLMEADSSQEIGLDKACDWLNDRQILDHVGDWGNNRKGVRPGGWAFQYNNKFYPDVDDTAVVAMALHRHNPEKYTSSIDRAKEWIIAMQSTNGGWAAFDADNDHYILENIPFADHGALLDPPTADVTARCISFLSQIDQTESGKIIKRGIQYLKSSQEIDGSWFGRWGTNYIYGTWSALGALNSAGEDMTSPYIRKAVDWLLSKQCEDGGWGEDCASYWEHRKNTVKSSMPSQTAWAILALMAAGEIENEAVFKGVSYLTNELKKNHTWSDRYFNAVGFPKVFYLKYYGYSLYFPLMALGRYNRLMSSNHKRTEFGI